MRWFQLAGVGVGEVFSASAPFFPVLWLATVFASLLSSASGAGPLPSYTSLISDIVLSKLRRRVLGLVIVVPKLAWRPCPRLKGEGEIEDVGDNGDVGELGEIGEEGTDPVASACSRAAATPFAGTGAVDTASGVAG